MLTTKIDKIGSIRIDSVSTPRLTLYVATAYLLLGALGLLLAIGPGYASPIFPAAGLALAAVLLFGRRALTGIWLGSVVLNLATPLLHGTLNPASTALALLIASGSTAQAFAGFWLVNRWQGAVWRNLERELDAMIFLLLGGVLACVISASIGVTGLCAANLIHRADILFSWWNWYVGDTLGVLIFAPLPLRLLDRSADRWNGRHFYILMPVLLMMTLLWLAFYGAAQLIQKDHEYRLNNDCADVTRRIADKLLSHHEILTSLHNFIEATPDFSFNQFELFTKITLKDNPDIFALSFNDLVANNQRLLFEKKMCALSPLGQFQITERDSQRRLIRAKERPEYVTVRYIVPLAGNVPAVGFDINSEPIRNDAINRARKTGSMAVTAPIQLVQEQKKRVGVLELMPVVDPYTVTSGEEQSPRLLGFAVSVVKVDEMIDNAVRGHLPGGLLFRVIDPNAPKGKELLYSSDVNGIEKIPPARSGNWKSTLRMGDRNWEFTAFVTGSYLQQQRPFIVWGIGIIAIITTGLLQLLIIGITGRTDEIRRTSEAVNAYLDNLFNDAIIPIIVWDSAFKITRFSRAFEKLTGRTAEEVIGQNITTIFPDDAIDHSLELINKTVSGERWETVEIPILHVNGTISTVLWNSSPIYGDDGMTPMATIAQGYDITVRKQTENELQVRIAAAITEIRQKDQMMISQSRQAAMGEMIGNIAHQWRQPLNALAMVLGNIQQAHQFRELTSEYIAEAVEKGNRLIQKMSTTINDFRNFFQPDKQAVTFSARDQINTAVSLVESSLRSHNISIHLELDQDIVLTGFPNEYSQVLLNMISNSRDAIIDSGVGEGLITIRIYKRDGQGCVSVGDNGGGIPDDVIDKIFEPYFSTKEMGTGIGLYMSKMIVERSMKGTIEARNMRGGAEFVVVTPLDKRLH